MSRDLDKEVETLRKDLMSCIKKSRPTNELSINLILSVVWLHFLADREERTKNPQERRRIIHEFKRGKKALEEGMRYVCDQAERGATEHTELLDQRHLS